MVVVNILDGLALTKFVVKPVLVTIFQKKILRERKKNTTRVSGVNHTNEYLDNYQNTNTPTVRFRDDVNAHFYA